MELILFYFGLYLGMCIVAFYVVISNLNRFKLRLKEITGE